MSSELRVDKIVPVDGVTSGGGGGIVQVQQTVKTDVFSSNSSSFHDITGMSVAITPSSSSNKVLINVALSYGGQDNMYAGINLLRGSTIVAQGDANVSNHRLCTFGIGGDNNNAINALEEVYLNWVKKEKILKEWLQKILS